MAWVMNNLICDDCPECDASLSVDFRGMRFAIHGQGPGSFAAVDFGVLGKAETKEDYDRCVKTIQGRFPGKRVEINHETASQKSDRIDTIRHNKKTQKRAGTKARKSHAQLARGE